MVSVIVPVYNAEKYLPQCLDSILGQTFRELELICVDDGSTDGSLELLRSYQSRDARLRVLTQKNGGAGAARNHGLACASGEFLSFLDADDFFEPNMLEEAVKSAQAYDSDFVVFRSDQYLMDKGTFATAQWTLHGEELPPYQPFSCRQLTGNVFQTFVGWAWDKLYRRSFVLSHGLTFQEQRTTNDLLFVFNALVLAKRISVVDQVLAHQRRGSRESLSVTRERSWHCFYDALTALRQRLIAENRFWELEKDFINYALHFSLWNLNTLAEPTHTLLKEKLLTQWLAELGVADKPQDYFYNPYEYKQYAALRRDYERKS